MALRGLARRGDWVLPSHPLSGYYCDALLNDLRHTSNWDPRYIATLDLKDGDHQYRLLYHIRTLLQLPTVTAGFREALDTAADWLMRPAEHNDQIKYSLTAPGFIIRLLHTFRNGIGPPPPRTM